MNEVEFTIRVYRADMPLDPKNWCARCDSLDLVSNESTPIGAMLELLRQFMFWQTYFTRRSEDVSYMTEQQTKIKAKFLEIIEEQKIP